MAIGEGTDDFDGEGRVNDQDGSHESPREEEKPLDDLTWVPEPLEPEDWEADFSVDLDS